MNEEKDEKIEDLKKEEIEEKRGRGPYRSKEQHIEAVNRRLEERSRNLDMCDFIRYMKG